MGIETIMLIEIKNIKLNFGSLSDIANPKEKPL